MALWNLKQLKYLDLGSTKITDIGLKELQGVTNLRRLILQNTQITDAGLKELQGLTLVTLQVDGTRVTHTGGEAFIAAHPGLIIYY
jgi:Leucine-rich repeat (LRR) protein